MDDDIIIAYGDIWFEEEPIKNMCMNDKDFAIAVDQDWEEYYHGRTEHPISEAENVYYDNNLLVKDIGKHIHDPKDNAYNTGEFMGLVKISKKIIKNVVNEFNNLELNIKKTDNFQKSVEFQNAYLTDFIQYLIGREYDISCCINKQGWYEVDTTQDLENLKFNLGF